MFSGKTLRTLIGGIFLMGLLHASDGLKLDGIFQDGMVLQRGRAVAISGYGTPESLVKFEIGGKTTVGLSSQDGRFNARLPILEAGTGYTLRVTDEKGGQELTLKEISVGDVYLIAGQSNMEFRLRSAKPGVESLTPHDYEGVRFFKIRPRLYYGERRELPGQWKPASEENAGELSAVGFFFARKLYQKTGIPVGLIDASLGGVNIESFLSRGALTDFPEYRDDVREYEALCATEESVRTGMNDEGLPDGGKKLMDGYRKLFPTVPDDGGVEKGYASSELDDSAWDTMRLPDSWTQAGHNHAGIFWFRRKVELPADAGESDWLLELGAVDKADKCYFNGQLVGGNGDPRTFDYWNTLRKYTIPKELIHAGENTIAVQALSFVSICTDGGMLGPEEAMRLSRVDGKDTAIPLGGIWRMKETFDAGVEGMTFMMKLGTGIPASYGMMHDCLIAPLMPFAVKGVLWYQGEANAICLAQRYRTLLLALIEEWRRCFEDANLPFTIIQLPDYHNPHLYAPHSQWALLREAQAQVAKETGSALVVTLGWGDVWDLHPVNKRAVGEAAAQMELARQAGEPIPTGPVFAGAERKGNRIVVRFTGGTLSVRDGGKEVGGFAIAGKDGVAYAATGVLTGEDTVEVFAEEVAEPLMLWYAWAENPAYADLTNGTGFPAGPFRFSLDGNPAPTAGNLVHQPH